MTGGAIKMAEDSELDLAGKNNTVTMLGDADLLARDKGQRLEVYGDDNHASISGSTIVEHGLADIDIDGKANTLRSTPTRPDLMQKELNSYQTSLQLMDSLWDRYDQLINISVNQEWRDLQSNRLQDTLHPEVFSSALLGDAKAADITGLTSSGTTLGPILTSTAASGLQTRPLIPVPASAQSVPVFS